MVGGRCRNVPGAVRAVESRRRCVAHRFGVCFAHASPGTGYRRGGAARGPAAGRAHRGARGSLRLPVPPLSQAVLRLVGGGLGALHGPDRRHHQLPPLRQLDLALLAPGGDRLDRAGPALRRAGLRPGRPVAAVVPGLGALSSSLVLHRDLPAGPVPLGRGSGSALPEPGHPGHRLGVHPLPATGGFQRRHPAGGGVRALGAASPRLPVSPGPGRLDALGLLPRHRLQPGDRRRDSSAGGR